MHCQLRWSAWFTDARATRDRSPHPRLAEVDAADQLADNHDVDALHDLPLQAARVRQLRQHRRRAQVGECGQPRPQGQQPALRPLPRRQAVPFVPAQGESLALRHVRQTKGHVAVPNSEQVAAPGEQGAKVGLQMPCRHGSPCWCN